MGKIRKKSSKRIPLKTKYVIERKVKDHKKKIRKEARKLKGAGIGPKSKLP
jgi:hypothetical protein